MSRPGGQEAEPLVWTAPRLEARSHGLPLGAIFLTIGVAAGLVIGFFHLDQLPFSLCTFKAVTGLPCLTCGTTRVMGQLLALDFGGALAMNPLAALGAAVLLVWGAVDLVLWPSGRALALSVSGRTAHLLRGSAVALLAANWIYLVVAGR